MWIITPLIDHHYSSTHLLNRHLFSRHLTQGTERAVLQAPRQTLGVERVRARQPAGAGRVHRGHADAAGRVIVIVRRVRGVPIAPGCGRLLHRNHRSAVRRFARAAAPAIEHHPVQPIAVRAAATRPPRSQVGLDDLPQHDSVFFSVRSQERYSAERSNGRRARSASPRQYSSRWRTLSQAGAGIIPLKT